MGTLRNVALIILAISFATFVALFGRLPALKKTPIGFLYRIIWVYLPSGIAYVDSSLLGGRFLRFWRRSGRYLLRENHPLVLIFFVALLSGSECMFVPKAWPKLTIAHRLCVLIAITLPYLSLYACVVTKSFVTKENLGREMTHYPYDRVLFHPGHLCRTCHLPKPPRSKHCRICNACISRHDHHCIWLTNCVGRHNYHYFMSLLVSTSVLLLYGVYLGYTLLDGTLQEIMPPITGSTGHWSKNVSWSAFFNIWGSVILEDIRIGAIFLLALMTAPLAVGFFLYHLYLIWAGMTTNENAKWAYWRDDIEDGFVFKAKRSEIYGEPGPENESPAPRTSWPAHSDQLLAITDGDPPRTGYMLSSRSNSVIQPDDQNAPVDPRWVRISSLAEVENIYDLGFWGNLQDVLKLL